MKLRALIFTFLLGLPVFTFASHGKAGCEKVCDRFDKFDIVGDWDVIGSSKTGGYTGKVTIEISPDEQGRGLRA